VSRLPAAPPYRKMTDDLEEKGKEEGKVRSCVVKKGESDLH